MAPQDAVPAARQQGEEPARLPGVAGLAEHPAPAGHHRVRREHIALRKALRCCGAFLAGEPCGQAPRQLPGRAASRRCPPARPGSGSMPIVRSNSSRRGDAEARTSGAAMARVNPGPGASGKRAPMRASRSPAHRAERRQPLPPASPSCRVGSGTAQYSTAAGAPAAKDCAARKALADSATTSSKEQPGSSSNIRARWPRMSRPISSMTATANGLTRPGSTPAEPMTAPGPRRRPASAAAMGERTALRVQAKSRRRGRAVHAGRPRKLQHAKQREQTAGRCRGRARHGPPAPVAACPHLRREGRAAHVDGFDPGGATGA